MFCVADATGEALDGLLRPGNAGAHNLADHFADAFALPSNEVVLDAARRLRATGYRLAICTNNSDVWRTGLLSTCSMPSSRAVTSGCGNRSRRCSPT